MKYLLQTLFIIPLFIGCQAQQQISPAPTTFHTKTKDISILIQGQTFPWTISADNLNFPFEEEGNNIGLAIEGDTFQIHLPSETKLPINFIINKKDTIQAILVGKTKPVIFSPDYILANKGTYKVFCPEVHELVNICMALSDIGRVDSNMIEMTTEYYTQVIQHFDEFKNHEIIDTMNKYLTEVFGSETYNYYYAFKMDACMYSFSSDRTIKNLSPYRKMAGGSENLLIPLLPLFEDFANKSNFHNFYKNHQSYYQTLIDEYYQLVPIDKMWKWVEEKFPHQYESYRIYFSPLVNGAHSTQNYSDNEFNETIMFICAPSLSDEYSLKEKEALLSRIVFTEIDHNYVNPSSDKFSEVSQIMKSIDCWNNNKQGYQSSYATFNEYMTYAVFTLYLYDNFDQRIFEKRNKDDVGMMMNGRGFIKYKGFNDFVLDWYLKNKNESLEKLYPQVIKWVNNQRCD